MRIDEVIEGLDRSRTKAEEEARLDDEDELDDEELDEEEDADEDGASRQPTLIQLKAGFAGAFQSSSNCTKDEKALAEKGQPFAQSLSNCKKRFPLNS